MEKQPGKRFATAGDAATVLGKFLEGQYETAGQDNDDDLLTFAEDADKGGSGISSKVGRSSSTRHARGGSSTAAVDLRSSNTVPDDLHRASDRAAAGSSSKATPEAPLVQENAKPASDTDCWLSSLGSSASLSFFDQILPAPAASASGAGQSQFDVLLPLSDKLPRLASSGSNLMERSDPSSSWRLRPTFATTPPKDRESGEVHYPLWALLGVGITLGLMVVGVGLLFCFGFR